MQIVITEWGFQSYLELKGVFTDEEYHTIIRPDAELLKDFPDHPKFGNGKFWGPCKDMSGAIIRYGYKMKWHNVGSGLIQLRLLVVIMNGVVYLCNAYVKDNESKDKREMAKLKIKIQLINEGRYTLRGKIV